MRTHDFSRPGLRNGSPILECANVVGCRTVWWPDRMKPKSACYGMTIEEFAVATAIPGTGIHEHLEASS